MTCSFNSSDSVLCSGSSPVWCRQSGGPCTYHERQLVRRSPGHWRRHHVSFLQPVAGVPGEPGGYGPGPKIISHQPWQTCHATLKPRPCLLTSWPSCSLFFLVAFEPGAWAVIYLSVAVAMVTRHSHRTGTVGTGPHLDFWVSVVFTVGFDAFMSWKFGSSRTRNPHTPKKSKWFEPVPVLRSFFPKRSLLLQNLCSLQTRTCSTEESLWSSLLRSADPPDTPNLDRTTAKPSEELVQLFSVTTVLGFCFLKSCYNEIPMKVLQTVCLHQTTRTWTRPEPWP